MTEASNPDANPNANPNPNPNPNANPNPNPNPNSKPKLMPASCACSCLERLVPCRYHLYVFLCQEMALSLTDSLLERRKTEFRVTWARRACVSEAAKNSKGGLCEGINHGIRRVNPSRNWLTTTSHMSRGVLRTTQETSASSMPSFLVTPKPRQGRNVR